MKYKRVYKIKGKVISKKDIISIIESVLEQYPKEKELSVSIEAKFKDEIIISDSSVALFEHNYFEKLVLEQVTIHFRHNYYSVIDIYIYSNRDFSTVTIELNDNNLYNSICHCIEENINLMKNQNKIYLLSSEIWGYFVLLGTVILLEILIILGIQYIIKMEIPTILISMMLILLPSVISVVVIKYIEKKFPINQFDFGEKSINKPNTEKSFIYKLISFIFINIVLPIIISYLTK